MVAVAVVIEQSTAESGLWPVVVWYSRSDDLNDDQKEAEER